MNDHRKIFSGAALGIIGGLSGRAVGLVGTLLIARHLTPDIVAEVTVATVIALTGNWIAAWGCGQYVVVRGGEGREAIFAASMVYLLAGIAMIAVLWWATPTLALWLQAPRVADYLPGALLGIGIRRLGAMPDKLLARELRFGRIALGTALGDVAYAVVVVLAWRWATQAHLAIGWRLAGEVLVGVVVYGGAMWGVGRDLVGDALAGLGMSRRRHLEDRVREGESTP